MRRLFCRFAPILGVCCAEVLAQTPQPARQAHAPYPAKWEPNAQELFLPYWTVEQGWSTELEIRNNVAWRDLIVTPILRTAGGAEITLQAVSVPPEHVASVDVRQALFVAAPQLLDREGSFGSVVYRYSGMSEANVFGASMVHRNESPIGFHFDSEPVEREWSPQATESVWWLPRETVSDYLILANASTQPLAGSLAVSDAAGRTVRQTVSLGPAETQRLDLRAITSAARLGGSEGGVTVLVPTGGGNLITSHIVFDETTGLSATMKSFGRDSAEKPRTHTMRAPMMALANPDPVLQFPSGTKLNPQVFLRNTGLRR
jgi:hypothetical protein